MKKIFLLFIFSSVSQIAFAQEDKLPDPEAYFSAFIVKNIEVSIDWYSTYLGFKVLDKKDFPKAGFKQANLKRGGVLIELIELDTAVSPKEAIDGYTAKTRIRGIFKIGFQISEFDKWMQHLRDLKVVFHGRIVKNAESGKKMVIIKDPDGNRIQLFEK